MGNIVLLDDLTINKIAAGEVIERPASVVKEMVENSIDAGAKNITIEIKNGGISLIKITDDGIGIAEDDMEIAFERHATSKIRKAEDLEVVRTMGFRGEALASIASIAKVEMISKKEGEELAHKIVVEGGKTLEFTEAARSVGTTITVENLFYNTPVRYKFLKKDYTETGYIEDAVTRIALVNRNVAIKLISNGKTIIQTNGNDDLKTVIYSIYGKDIASEIIEVDYSFEGIHITGVVGKPIIARGNRANQVFFLNGRYIKDKNLTSAADQAYKGMIPVGRYGFIVLNLDMDPKMVDVNVHPAKLEVRFEEESKVFKAVYHAIKSNLAKSELVSDVSSGEEINPAEISAKVDDILMKYKNKKELSSVEKKEEVTENNEENEDKKSGITGLFKKIMKEPDETPEELNNNHLEEIFKYRQGLKDNLEVPEVVPEVEEEEKEEEKVNLESTQIMEIVDKPEKNEEVEATGVTQDTVVLEKNDLEKEEVETNIDTNVETNIKSEEEKVEDNSFAKIAEKMVEAKLGFDNTQSIDTKIVREKLKEQEFEANPEFDQMYKKTFGVDTSSVRREKQQEELEKQKLNASNEFSYVADNMNVFEDEQEDEKPKIPYKFLGIAFSTYIIIEIKNEMYIIDQHAAHERIMYEKVKANYYSEDEKDEQFLLMPDVITLSHKEMIIAKQNVEMFEKAGFSFEDFGDNTIKLNSVPSMCEILNTKQLFLDILDEINTVAVTAKQEKEDKFIATVACKAAVKANMKLDEKEVINLIEKLLELPNPFTCPHGRPTAIKMNKNDLEKKFNRR